MAIDAISALSGTLELDTARGPGSVSGATPGAGPSFSQTLTQVVGDAVKSVQGGEAASIQGLQGGMAPFKVVEAVMNAQRTLQSVVSIRDKAVAAYQEISRMSI